MKGMVRETEEHDKRIRQYMKQRQDLERQHHELVRLINEKNRIARKRRHELIGSDPKNQSPGVRSPLRDSFEEYACDN